MFWNFKVTLFTLLLSGMLGGCSTWGLGPRPPAPNSEKCLALYEQVDWQIAQAGVADAGHARIPGFPYLRVDRYSASFAEEIPSLDAFWQWVGYLRANEDEARDVELRNLGLGKQAAFSLLLDLRGCGAWLRSWELENPEFREKLLDRVKPADHYSTVARALGFYPVAAPFLDAGVDKFNASVLDEYARPLDELEVSGELKHWRVAPSDQYKFETMSLADKPRDLLGRIGMLWSDVVQLARFHAPELLIETAGDYDLPGTPRLSESGPGVDTRRPVVYFLPGLTRFGGRSLLQINYFIWFDERPASAGEAYAAGALDGVIWRVTLDDNGDPLLHDTIHACGCYHYGFPAQALQRRNNDHPQHAMLLPQEEVPTGRVAVRLQSGTHAVRRVLEAEAVSAQAPQHYELRSYEELLTLPAPEGGTRSLFGEDGLVAGSERSERFWLWPSGVRSAGAMRQWGHHATAFTGKAYFDDPFLLEEVFVPEMGGSATPPLARGE